MLWAQLFSSKAHCAVPDEWRLLFFSCVGMFIFQAMFDWLDNTVIKLCNMPPVGTDLNTVKDQLNEMKVGIHARQDSSVVLQLIKPHGSGGV